MSKQITFTNDLTIISRGKTKPNFRFFEKSDKEHFYNVQGFAKAIFGEPLTISKGYTAKMEGMNGLSTISSCNGICKKRMTDEKSICHWCYVGKGTKPAPKIAYSKNFYILTRRELTEEEILALDIESDYFRFESHGDLYNIQQAKNYLKIALIRKELTCAIWTKNAEIWRRACNEFAREHNWDVLEMWEKIPNLQKVLSSRELNRIDKERFESYGEYFDRVFTVWDDEHIASENVNINCGANLCRGCLRCYRKSGEKFINERMK